MMKIKLNDRVLTAYVLDELSLRKRRAVARALKTDETARRIVQELEAAVQLTGEALKEAPAYALRPEQRREIINLTARSRRRPGLALWLPGRIQVRRLAYAAVLLLILVGVGIMVMPRFTQQICRGKKGAMLARMQSERTVTDKAARLGARVLNEPRELACREEASVRSYERKDGLWSVRGVNLAKPGSPSTLKSRDYIAGGATRGFADWHDDPSRVYWPGHDTEAYDNIVDNPFLEATQNPLSTFSIDVDTASYANVRRFLTNGNLPPKDAVRIEEMVNYFSYDYAPPVGDVPFSAAVEVAGCPWKPEHRLVRIGLKGWEMPEKQRPPGNLVFLLDVSGSMSPSNKLPLLKRAMKMLVEQLNGNDRVAIVVYAGASGLVLPSTTGDNQEALRDALERLESGGSTNGGAGIQLAYDTAAQHFIDGGVNRVILATDGDFNVGVTNRGDLVRLIEDKAKSGVFLTVLGFGMGNIKDSALEQLADKGNGNYAYLDTIREAKKVLVEEMGSTLVTIAKDVKIQVEFNPAEVAAYRLIGYENRMLRDEDFNDDTKDAGEIGAGHTVTALYEIVPPGSDIDLPEVDPLKYQRPAGTAGAAAGGELLTLKLRYKEPDGEKSRLLEFPVVDTGKTFADADADFAFAAAVASFGMLLRDSEHRGNATFSIVLDLAEAGRGEDPHGYRAEFIDLVKKAAALGKRR
ncbi:MAG: von Willebrand factor type A domain-containing protein [PVC group bacterium]